MNITSAEAELMAICIGLIPAIENPSNHQILIVTDAITAAKQILESRPNPFQKAIIPIASSLKAFLEKDNRNRVHFWQCPNKAQWPRHKLVDDQVKASKNTSLCPSKNSYLFSRKKECEDILKEWQDEFAQGKKKGQLFLDFKDEKQSVIKPTYSKGGSWLPSIEFTNALCARFTRMTMGYAPIGEYCQRFFPNTSLSCPCGQTNFQT